MRPIQMSVRSRPRESAPASGGRLQFAGPTIRLRPDDEALAALVELAASPLPELDEAEELALERR